MSKTVVEDVFDEAERRIRKRLAICDKIIDDFVKPCDPPLDDKEKHRDVEERMSGRLSVGSLSRAYEEKRVLENQLQDIANFKYYNSKYFKVVA